MISLFVLQSWHHLNCSERYCRWFAMLNDATCFKQIYIVCGYTDLRSGIDTLVSIINSKTGNPPYLPDTLYLFCGRKADRIKGLVWEQDGFFYTKGWKMESLYGPAPNLMCSPLPPGSSAGWWRDLQSHRRNLSSRQSHLNIRHDVCAKSRNFQLLFTMKKAVYWQYL